ncbi:MAG: acetyl-CoA carboxylase carboxyltransferase subunit alpha [Acidobacteriota bacterium]|nr:MAG: acetyl-CoA carboxylase carboxyltransferase subunit alpha [Acidobacteriota bacterium]
MKATAFERVQTARHPERPYALDLLSTVFEDFVEVHGDRRFADDPAMLSGFARLGDTEVCVVGQQKGRDLNERRFRNFAMPKPEGYRKALRVMRLAEKFGRPIVTIIDTPGAYPGIDAEERGQAEAIAFNLREMARIKVPIVVVVLGEGGSGGALAIGIGDRVLMMENAVYSVISPEGCAAILWKDAAMAPDAAAGLRLTAAELKKFDIIDKIIAEPEPWTMPAGDDDSSKEAFDSIASTLRKALSDEIDALSSLPPDKLLAERYAKFRKMGQWVSE